MVIADFEDPFTSIWPDLGSAPIVDVAEVGWDAASNVVNPLGGIGGVVGDIFTTVEDYSTGGVADGGGWFDDYLSEDVIAPFVDVVAEAGSVYEDTYDWTSGWDDWGTTVLDDSYYFTDCWGYGDDYGYTDWSVADPTFDYWEPLIDVAEPAYWEDPFWSDPYIDTFGVDDLTSLGDRLGIQMPDTVDEFIGQLGAGNTQDLLRHLGGNDLDDLVGALGETGAQTLVGKLADDGQLGDFLDAADGNALQGLLTKVGADDLQGVLGRLDPQQTTDVLSKLIDVNRPVSLLDDLVLDLTVDPSLPGLDTIGLWDELEPVTTTTDGDGWGFFDDFDEYYDVVDYVVAPAETEQVLGDAVAATDGLDLDGGIRMVEETVSGFAGDLVQRVPDPSLYEYDEQGNLLEIATGAVVQAAGDAVAVDAVAADASDDFTGLADPSKYPVDEQSDWVEQEASGAPAAAADVMSDDVLGTGTGGVTDVFAEAPAAAADVMGDDVLGTGAMADATGAAPLAADDTLGIGAEAPAMADDVLGIGAEAPATADSMAMPDVPAVPDLPDAEIADPLADLTAPAMDAPDLPDLPDVPAPDIPDAVDTAVTAADQTSDSVDDMFNELN